MNRLDIEHPLTSVWGNPPARETVSTAAYRKLREAVLSGALPMGTRINELELAQAWNVSRTPIRDALRRLEAEGLVQATPGRGVMVPHMTLADADELYELREVLEGRAARRAAERATPEFHTKLHGLIKAFGMALKQGEVDQMVTIDTGIHTGIAVMSGNGRLAREIEGIRAQVYHARLESMRTKGRAAKSFREMATLTAAVRARNGVRAETAMREHIASLRSDLAGTLEVADGQS